MRLGAAFLYPVKSSAPLAVREALVEPRGLAHDRRFLVVEPDGRFVTGRQLTALVRVSATPIAAGVRLDAPNASAFDLLAPEGNAERIAVTIWKDAVDAAACDPQADAWISRVLGRPLRFAYMDALAERPVSRDYGREGDVTSFSDGYPILVLGRASMDALNARIAARSPGAKALPIERFRPNLVIEGAEPHAEDGWKKIRIGPIELDLVKPCTRCVFTTVDIDRGEYDDSGEPLETLKTYRRSERGITFGQNAIARSLGVLRVGDPVEVLA